MSGAQKAVFLSYASQDAEAATRICAALRAAGVEVWFDQSELRGGDAWDQSIRKQIKECALFIPIVSASTQARMEGYFRLEWKLAAQRTHAMADAKPFLLPLVIDGTRDGDAHVPAEFRAVQWTRLPDGETPQGFCERVRILLDGKSRPGILSAIAGHGQASRAAPKGGRPVLGAAAAIAAIVALALVMFVAWPNRKDGLADTGAGMRSPIAQQSAPPLTPAQKLVAQARQVYESGDELNRENLSLADDLVQQALKLDPAEPTAWELAARLSYVMVWQQIADSDERREAMQRQAVRALALAPNSVDAQLVDLNVRLTGISWVASGSDQQQGLRDTERELTALAAREPTNWQVQRALGMAYRFLNRPEDSLSALRRAVELSHGDPSATADLVNVLERRKQLKEAEALVATGLARKPTARLLAQDVFFKTRWRGDPAGAEGAIAAWPGWLLQDDRGLFMAWQTFYWKREPEKALGFANRFPRDYLHDAWFAGPRAVLTARAHEMAGHAEAAQADWRSVGQVVARELARQPEDSSALYWKAWALARLGQRDEARALCLELLQRGRSNRGTFLKGTNLAPLLITAGLTEDALADVQTQLTSFNDSNTLTRAVLELDPAFDSIRNDPRFRQLVASAPAPETNPTAARTGTDDKSIAVLPFENMSADRDNGYFCDGIQEDILTNLGNIADLRVISRTSVMQYRDTTKPVPQIARELGVRWILEGSVQRAGNKVRVTGQLINAQTDDHAWAKAYDRDLTDIFAIQTEIARAIAVALQAKLSPEEQRQVEHRPTANAAAYDLYLKARGLGAIRRSIALREQQAALLQEAVKLDPSFAEAWAELAVAHARFIELGFDNSVKRREQADGAIAQAVRLAPDSPEVIRAVGAYAAAAYGDQVRAQEQYEKLLRLRPNDPTVHSALAGVFMNQGRWPEALASARRAAELDPANATYATQVLHLLGLFRRWPEAIAAEERWLKVQPGDRNAEFELARLHFYATGDVATGNAFFAGLPPAEADSPDMTLLRKNWDFQIGALGHFVALDQRMPDHPDFVSADNPERMAYALVGALAHLAAGQRAAAEARAGDVAAQARALAAREPTNSQAWTALGLAEVLFGDKAAGLRAAQRAVELKPDSPAWRLNLAIVKAWAGDHDGALTDLKQLLSRGPATTIYVQGWLNVHQMRACPAFAPLKSDPRFQALINDPKNNAPLY